MPCLFLSVSEELGNWVTARLILSPGHLVDNTHIGLNDLHNLGADIDIGIIRYGNAVIFVVHHFDSQFYGLKKAGGVYAGEDKTSLVQCLRTLGRGADTDGRDRCADGGVKSWIPQASMACRRPSSSSRI